MNFFEAQEQARKRTFLLVLLFAAAVVGIIAAVYVVAHFALLGPEAAFTIDPILLGYVAAGTGLLVGLGSAFRSAQLRQGGAAVAQMLGGRTVTPDTTDPYEQRLVNVVEEMAIASGTPVPDIYVLDREQSINAFAAGYHTHDAAIAVTRGTLEKLNRQELQGVIAHEFSHVLNGDMRMNIRLIGLLFGILLLTVVGRIMLYTRAGGGGRRGGGGQAAILLGLAVILIGYIGVFFGKMIKGAVSRQREYLADSAAVQFTRDPQGLAGALKKIGGDSHGGRISDPHAEEASHLFFANGLRATAFRFTATHPPLAERIRRIDPSWDGEWVVPETTEAQVQPGRREGIAGRPTPGMARRGAQQVGALGAWQPEQGPGSQPASADLAAAALMASIGAPTGEHVSYAGELLDAMPRQLHDAAHDPTSAQALIFAMLMADEPHARAEQEAVIRGYEKHEPTMPQQVDTLFPLLREQDSAARLPLIDIALPALRRLPRDRSIALQEAVRRLILADGTVRMFDYTLVHILARQLAGPEKQSAKPAETVRSFRPILVDVEAVLSAIAHSGAASEAEAHAAFTAGAARLPAGSEALRLQDPGVAGLGRIDEALRRIEHGSFDVRRQVLDACAHTVAYDGRVRTAEAELLRAVSEVLDCPMPPVLG